MKNILSLLLPFNEYKRGRKYNEKFTISDKLILIFFWVTFFFLCRRLNESFVYRRWWTFFLFTFHVFQVIAQRRSSFYNYWDLEVCQKIFVFFCLHHFRYNEIMNPSVIVEEKNSQRGNLFRKAFKNLRENFSPSLP